MKKRSYLGTVVRGIRLPIISAGEQNIKNIIIESIIDARCESEQMFKDNDIICITESLVARAENNYISVDDIAKDIDRLYGENSEIIVFGPIYSRNRFSMILKGIARSASKIYLVLDNAKDEVGNDKINPFTGIDIEKFYEELILSENCQCHIYTKSEFEDHSFISCSNILYARCHVDEFEMVRITNGYNNVNIHDLTEICNTPSNEHGYNEEYGLLGSNKASEETLKLFPRKETCKELCEGIKKYFYDMHNVYIEVMIYGDGCFKDPVGNIWEFADPVVSPYYTSGLEGTPNEIKIKYIADNESSNKEYIIDKIKNKDSDLKGKMLSQGTTPRRYSDLIGSLADLTSGSGDKGTPVVWISGYFNNYID